jgi:hypothetical protein
MAWAKEHDDGDVTYERCIRTAIEGDEVCEPCRAAIEKLLHDRRITAKFRDVLKTSVKSPAAKNGDVPHRRRPGK